MDVLAACLAGMAGALAIEVSELYGAIKASKTLPWLLPGEVPFGIYIFTVGLRLGLGAFAAWLCASTGPLGTAGAVAAGIAAPKLLEELGKHAPNPGAAITNAQAKVSRRPDKPVGQPPAGESTAAHREGGSVDAPQS